MALRRLMHPVVCGTRAASAAVALGTASGWALARLGKGGGAAQRSVSAESMAANSDDKTKRSVVGRFCLKTGFADALPSELAKQKIEETLPAGRVVSVLECKPGAVVQYKMDPETFPTLQSSERAPSLLAGEGNVCFDYAVVLTGRIEQYLAQGQPFPATAGPGSFLTEHATLHNSWQVSCHIALVRL